MTQEALKLALEALEANDQLINASKYDHMTTATVMGVLEMTKLHYWQCNLAED